jgi:hypothetical protein
MSTPAIRHLARQIQNLTYDEMMEVADWFSLAMSDGYDEDQSSIDKTKITTAQLLSDWAEDILSGG